MSAAENLRPWKKGQSGNPGGRPKLPEDLRAIKALSQEEVCRIVAKYARMAPDLVEVCIVERRVSMVELAVAKIFSESAAKGDWQRLAFLLDRAVGKVPVVAPTDAEAEAIEDIRALSDQELLRLVKEKIPALEPPA